MLFIEYPGCELVAWDGPSLYAASDTGWCSRLLPDRFHIVPGKSNRRFRNQLLDVRGDLILVGRTMREEAILRETMRGLLYPPANRFVQRISDSFMSRETYLTDPSVPAGDDVFTGGNFDHRFEHAILWGAGQVLLASRLDAFLFDLTAGGHQVAPFALDAGRGPRRLGGPSDRGVVQVLAERRGGFLALMDGGTMARLTIEGGEAVLRPTPVVRSDWAVWGCQITEDRVLYIRRGGTAALVDRVTNAEVCGLPVGSRAATLHPNGSIVALADGDCLTLGRADSPQRAQRFAVSGGQVRHVAFAPDGLTVAVANAQGVTVFDVG